MAYDDAFVHYFSSSRLLTSTARSFPSLVLTIGGRLTAILRRSRIDPTTSSYLRRASPGACRGEGGARRTYSLFAHGPRIPFEAEGAPFPLLIGTPPTVGRSLRCFHELRGNILLISSPSCFAACGHHLFPRMAVVCSLLSITGGHSK